MIYYLKGKIVEVNGNHIIIDVNNIAYDVIVSHPEIYLIGNNFTLYTYTAIREDETYLIGFNSLEEKEIFLSLIKVKGLGPKTVINLLGKTSPKEIIKAIKSNNVAYLKRLPLIGSKAAYQIILDLKGEYSESKGNPKVYEEAFLALKELGFKSKKIDDVLSTINEENISVEELIKLALQKL